MKRIKLLDKIRNIINLYGSCYGPELIVKLISENYRRRQYHKKGYSCHCGKFHKPMQLCSKKG